MRVNFDPVILHAHITAVRDHHLSLGNKKAKEFDAWLDALAQSDGSQVVLDDEDISKLFQPLPESY